MSKTGKRNTLCLTHTQTHTDTRTCTEMTKYATVLSGATSSSVLSLPAWQNSSQGLSSASSTPSSPFSHALLFSLSLFRIENKRIAKANLDKIKQISDWTHKKQLRNALSFDILLLTCINCFKVLQLLFSNVNIFSVACVAYFAALIGKSVSPLRTYLKWRIGKFYNKTLVTAKYLTVAT